MSFKLGDTNIAGSGLLIEVPLTGESGTLNETQIAILARNQNLISHDNIKYRLISINSNIRIYSQDTVDSSGVKIEHRTITVNMNTGAWTCVTVLDIQVPALDSALADGTYVYKAVKAGTTITYNWVKES